MAYDVATLTTIFKKTDGRCHLCHKKLCFNNYGSFGTRGSWHVEHSKARANGGTDHGNNLYAACIKCNLKKSTYSTRTARSWNGHTKAPLSKAKKDEIRGNNTWIGGAVGVLFGAAVVGTGGAVLLFGALGALTGNTIRAEH